MNHEDKYAQVLSVCRTAHAELLRMEREGKISEARDNPGLVGDYLTKLRLNCNLLYSFMNAYLDIMNEALAATASKRQVIYVEQLELKKSPSAADSHASNMTRVDEANIKIIQNKLQQIKNDYERFSGICYSLQSRMKEFGDERRGL